MELTTGAIVEISGQLSKFIYSSSSQLKVLTFAKPRKVLVLGTSIRLAGEIEIDEYGWKHMISVTETRQVWIVMPLMGNRYRKPIAVLAEQIVQPTTTTHPARAQSHQREQALQAEVTRVQAIYLQYHGIVVEQELHIKVLEQQQAELTATNERLTQECNTLFDKVQATNTARRQLERRLPNE